MDASDRVVEYLRLAEKNRELAALAHDENTKQSLLALADDYETLAAVVVGTLQA